MENTIRIAACVSSFASLEALAAMMVAVLSFELVLNLCSIFKPSNVYVYLSPRLDKVLRYLLITPNLHRIHHAVVFDESNRNFGFSVPWWDPLFGSFLAKAHKQQTKIKLGNAGIKSPHQSQRLWLLLTYIPMKEVSS